MPKRSNVSRKLKRGRNKKQTKKCKSGGGGKNINTENPNPNIPPKPILKREIYHTPEKKEKKAKVKYIKIQENVRKGEVESIKMPVNVRNCTCTNKLRAWYCCFNKNMVKTPKIIGKGGYGIIYFGKSRDMPIAYKVVDLGTTNTDKEYEKYTKKSENFIEEVKFATEMGSLDIGPQVIEAFINEDEKSYKGVLLMKNYTMSLDRLFEKMREEHDSYKPDVIQNIGQIVFNIMKKMAGSGHMCGDVKAANFVVNLDETDKKDKKVIDGRMIDFGVGIPFCGTYKINTLINNITYTPELLTYAMAFAFRYNTIMTSYYNDIEQYDVLPGLERGVYSDKKLIDDKTLTDLNSILHAQPFYSNMHHYTKDALEKINKKLIDEDKPKNESKNKLNNEPKNESKNKLNNQPKNELNNQPNNQSNNETMKKPIKKPMKKLEKDIILEITKNMIDKYINGIADGILSVEPLESVKLKLITISDGINTVNISNTVNTAPMANTVNTAPMSNTVSTAPMANTVPTASMASTVPTASMANTEPTQIDT